MVRIETTTFEYTSCGQCPNALDWLETGLKGNRCLLKPHGKGNRIIKEDLWEGMPDWCPLDEKS